MNAPARLAMVKSAPAAQPASTPEPGYVVSRERLLELFPGRTLKEARKELRNLISDNRDPIIAQGPTAEAIGVRIAGPEDEEAILALLKIDVAENADKIAPGDDERILLHIRLGTRREGAIIAVIDGPDGQPVATVGLFPSQWWWSNGWCIQERWSYVHPDHRTGTQHAARLLQFAKWVSDEWSKGAGYRLYLLAGVLASHRVADKARFYARHMTRAGIFTIYPTPPDYVP